MLERRAMSQEALPVGLAITASRHLALAELQVVGWSGICVALELMTEPPSMQRLATFMAKCVGGAVANGRVIDSPSRLKSAKDCGLMGLPSPSLASTRSGPRVSLSHMPFLRNASAYRNRSTGI